MDGEMDIGMERKRARDGWMERGMKTWMDGGRERWMDGEG